MTALSTLWNKKQKSCIFFFYIVSEREERFPKLVSRKFPHKPKRHSQIKGHHITNPTNALCLVGNPSKLHLHCLIIDPHLMTTANSFGENKKHVSPFTDPIWVIFGAFLREYLRKQKINLTNTRHPCRTPLHAGSTSLGGSLETDATTERLAWQRPLHQERPLPTVGIL